MSALIIPWHLPILAVAATEDAACRRCEGALELVQPLRDRPDELLGSCPACGNWYLLAGAVSIELDGPLMVDRARSLLRMHDAAQARGRNGAPVPDPAA
jgi:hypothetical protein